MKVMHWPHVVSWSLAIACARSPPCLQLQAGSGGQVGGARAGHHPQPLLERVVHRRVAGHRSAWELAVGKRQCCARVRHSSAGCGPCARGAGVRHRSDILVRQSRGTGCAQALAGRPWRRLSGEAAPLDRELARYDCYE